MAWEMKDGSGSLFKNRKKEKDSHPDERGDCMIGGVVYEVSAWVKTTKNGDEFRSLSIKQKREKPDNAAPKPKAPISDDDIPF